MRSLRLTYSILIPSAEDYERVYGSYDYDSEDDARTDVNRQREAALAESLLPYKLTGNVLDVAAGAGRFLEHFKELGFDCYATEFDSRLEEMLRAKGFHVVPGGTSPAPAKGCSASSSSRRSSNISTIQ